MSHKYPVLPPTKISFVLNQLGFTKISQKGSHAKYKNNFTNKVCIIPMHSEVARGTLKSILEQDNISIDEFLNFL